MVVNGQNILDELDNLLHKTVRILTVQEEELYGTGYIGTISNIQKRYWDKGHYNVYDITIDLKGFEEINRRHDSRQYEGNKAYVDMDFYTGEITYRICVEYDKYKLKFDDDLETDFFEIVKYTVLDSYNLEINKYYNKIYEFDNVKYTPRNIDVLGTVFFDRVVYEYDDGALTTGGKGYGCSIEEFRELNKI